MYPLRKTFQTLFTAKLLGLMLACAALALFVVLVLAGLVTWMAAHVIPTETGWLKAVLSGAAGILTGVGGWFMLPALTVLISGFFQEHVIRRVERVYYPETEPEGLPFWPELWHDVTFTLWALCLNILVLPLYVVGIGFLVSILLNSYLLGREFFESAAGYHLGKASAKDLGKQHKKAVYGGGLAITLMTLLPLLNFFVPILAIVWMVHVYHHIRRV